MDDLDGTDRRFGLVSPRLFARFSSKVSPQISGCGYHDLSLGRRERLPYLIAEKR